jgi:hypothetical protein
VRQSVARPMRWFARSSMPAAFSAEPGSAA